HRTAGIVAERLREAGYEVTTGMAGTGVVGTLKGGGGDGPTLLLRADMDALPIEEATGAPYASTVPGRMHACGHDGHVAIGLAVAERLARRRSEISGEVRYVFQPAEEGMGGARRMVEAGVLDGVDAALGLHIWLDLPLGVVGVVDGPQMAGSQEFAITVHGRGGHGGLPHGTIDAVLLASQIVVALQSIVSRNISPLDNAVVSVGSIRAGSAPNIIAETAYLEGTIRAFRSETLATLRGRISAVAEGVAQALGGSAEASFADLLFPPTSNDPELARLVRETAQEVVSPGEVRADPGVRTMAAEDFAEFSTRVPGCYFFLGAHDEVVGAIHPHHSPYFDIAEDCLPLGVEILERAALRFLAARS
ncbi:MAG TPA: amidohydrolase, partial [Longimicrobiaceae bacterium]|nr:amidohydrolase [Longimicrobiaceae bacterium]